MRLSPLQRHILGVCLSARGKAARAIFDKAHTTKERRRKDAVDAVTKSLERMIDTGLLIGMGVKTPKRWYIKEVRLTPMGRKAAKRLQGEQQRLPLR